MAVPGGGSARMAERGETLLRSEGWAAQTKRLGHECMTGLVAVVFDSGNAAAAALEELRKLHDQGVITVFGSAIICRDARTQGVHVVVPIASGDSPAVPSLAAAISAIIVLFGGAPTVAAASTRSGIAVAISDLAQAGLDAGFLHMLCESLGPGATAVLAEIEEDERRSIDVRLMERGALILRQQWPPFPEDEIARHMEPLLGAGSAIRAGARHGVRLSALAGVLRRELRAKNRTLQSQALGLSGEQRLYIERRAAQMRSVMALRLNRLQELTTSAGQRGGNTSGQ